MVTHPMQELVIQLLIQLVIDPPIELVMQSILHPLLVSVRRCQKLRTVLAILLLGRDSRRADC